MQLAPKLTPCLWFEGQALAAARFYTSVVPESRILNVTEFSTGPDRRQRSGAIRDRESAIRGF